jgi:hypothetical protein
MAQVKESFSPNHHLRGEIMRRWQQLSASEIDESCTDRSKLVAFLQNRYGYARRRAEQEVELFYGEFRDRLRMAA